MKHCAILVLLALCLSMGCSRPQKRSFVVVNKALAMGDSTLYGLVCDGSNDSIVVFLPDPYDGSDPDTLDILEASSLHQVFGILRIGDKIALKRNPVDSTKADLVIVTQDLLGQWCYKVKPTLRRRAGMYSSEHMPDSVRQLLEEEREFGIMLKVDSVAFSVGQRPRATVDEESPVEYPPVKRYRKWYISNGHLMLMQANTDSLGNAIPVAVDTVDLVRLDADTLVLRFSNGEHSYYRKKEEAE